MAFIKYYRRFIADVRKVALDDDRRYQIQYRYILKILLVVVVFSGILNLITERYTMGFLMLILGFLYFLFYMIIYKKKARGANIVTWLMIFLSFFICIEVIIHGTTGGVAPLWTLLFPILSLLLCGKRKGAVSSLLLLLCILFLFWTPIGRGMLLHEYDRIFMQRYPIVYGVVFIVAIFYETLRSTMVRELQHQKEQMESVYQYQYHSMESRIAEARKIRHDLRHHYLLINQFLADGQIEEAKAYVDRYYKALPFEEALIYCSHYATNALLTYYGQLAKDNGINIDFRMNLPSQVGISTEDLTVVFGNLLENAMQASMTGMQEDSSFKPWIKIMGNYDGSALVMSVSNASLHKAQMNEHGIYISTKHEGVGVGVHSVSEVVEKYDGSFKVEQPEGEFSAILIMYAKEQ